ncbi:hypothetical protein J3R30DRAFT_3691935 [Lentinula aciculospora]|uniref:Serine/threonine-protein phosphatase 2A activator n=1 Tax=Lentinula aciculospora TaxID=153920 RepID=A0A9W9DE45_9AGAR|nr:hypothetical protein J3R30DRAFT_3691935 [Lentinula aciculospora]
MVNLIDTLNEWIEDTPPLDSPQRFGNLALRTRWEGLEQYLRLCWKLQDVYRLEPAGSHEFQPSMRFQCQQFFTPPLPPTNLYFMSIMRIHEVKQGPFYEHSSQLHSIAVGVPHWRKVKLGRVQNAQVLTKRVVVQHIPLGGLLPWGNGSPDMTRREQDRIVPFNNIVSSSSAAQASWVQSTSNHYNSYLAKPNTILPSWSIGLSQAMHPRPRTVNAPVPTSSPGPMPPPLSSIRGRDRDSQDANLGAPVSWMFLVQNDHNVCVAQIPAMSLQRLSFDYWVY